MPDILNHVSLHAAHASVLRRALKDTRIDLACGGARRRPDGGASVEAFITDDTIETLRAAGVEVIVIRRDIEAQLKARHPRSPTSKGFGAGLDLPRGLGIKE